MAERDPFERHFARPNADDLEPLIVAVKAEKSQTVTDTDASLGKVVTSIPEAPRTQPSLKRKRGSETAISEKDIYSIKKRLQEPSSKVWPVLSRHVSALAGPLFDYQDVLYGSRTPKNAGDIRKITAIHALNHIYKTRDRVLRNNERLRASQQQDPDGGQAPDDIQDQGFTRPKVLILLETRSAAAKYVDEIIALAEPAQQENKKRFESEFGEPEGKPKIDDSMPADFQELFSGNDDNHFLATVKFTRKTVKFYSGFNDSDIILASPLGLRRAMTKKEPKKPDADFLSSIEILVLDQVDAMLMQNFEHTRFVLVHLNRTPRQTGQTDYARVRPYYLDGSQAYLRQTLVYSAYLTPELNALYKTNMLNIAGKLKITPATYTGTMQAGPLSTPLRQTFTRIAAPTPQSDPDARFTHFTTVTLPALHKLPPPAPGRTHGILLFAPRYFDYARLRAHLDANPDALPCPHATLDEYADVATARRARSRFVRGAAGALLYSGRAHHFRRYALTGVRAAVLYGVPDNPAFHAEVLRMLSETVEAGYARADEVGLRCLFSRWEGMALERVVGSARVGRMVRDEGTGDVFEFR